MASSPGGPAEVIRGWVHRGDECGEHVLDLAAGQWKISSPGARRWSCSCAVVAARKPWASIARDPAVPGRPASDLAIV